MSAGRYAPLVLGALFVVRVAACRDGGDAGPTTPSGPPATCTNGDVVYLDGEGQTQTHACPNHDCWIDAATGSGACKNPGAAGEKPFLSCHAAADCTGATYCATWGDGFAMRLGSPACTDGVCDWATEAQQACTGGQLCWPTACATVYSGTTSGGFPWEPCNPGVTVSCPGGSGTGGNTGGTGGAGAGGSGGAAGGGGAAAN